MENIDRIYNECMKDIKEAQRMFGVYTMYDKGLYEVMFPKDLVNSALLLSHDELANLLIKFHETPGDETGADLMLEEILMQAHEDDNYFTDDQLEEFYKKHPQFQGLI